MRPMTESAHDHELRREQAAFDEQLDDLLRQHAGEFVLFRDLEPADFFPTFQAAYEAALERFGSETFLVSEVVKRPPEPASWSWEAGVLVG